MGFLDKGSLLKHRRLQLTVAISDVADGVFLLKWAGGERTKERDSWSDYSIRGRWSAAELVRDFVPLVESSRWDRILDADSPIDNDNPRGVYDPLLEV